MHSIDRRRFVPASIVLALVMSACSTGGGVSAIPGSVGVIPGTGTAQPPAHRHARAGRLVLHIKIPKKRRHHRHAHYISPATQSMTIGLTGPTPVSTTAPLTASSQGCSGTLSTTYCTLSIALQPGSYSGSISTADANGHELSANQSVSFHISSGQANSIGITLGGIPTSAIVVPDAASTLSGSMSAGFTLSKCGSDQVSVYGVDTDGNLILGAGAPTPSLQSDTTSSLTVSTPSPYAPNTFTIVRPSPPPSAASTVHLTAKVTPDAESGASPVSTSIPMTFNHDICGALTEFSGLTRYPVGIANGPDGNIWFTEDTGGIGGIGKITTGGVVTEYTSGINGVPERITTGPDGNLWFTEGGNLVGTITPGGTVTEYSNGISAGADPWGITTGPDGNLWFTEQNGQHVAKITTNGAVTEYSGFSAGSPQGIVTGPDGNLWFGNCGPEIGTISTSGSGTLYTAGITGGTAPLSGIASGPDGNLWFTEYYGGRVGKITTSGNVTEYTASSKNNPALAGITAGPDGNLWYAECSGSAIGKMTTAGVFTEYFVTPGAAPNGITVGPDGSLWFTEIGGKRIGRLQ